MYLVYSKE